MSERSSLTFSQQIKQELCEQELPTEEMRETFLLFACMSAGVFRGKKFRFSTGTQALAEGLQRCFFQIFQWKPVLEQQGKRWLLSGISGEQYAELIKWLEEKGKFNTIRGQSQLDPYSIKPEQRRIAFRSIFLTTGSLTDPQKAYHLELLLHRKNIMELILKLLEIEGLPNRWVLRSGSYRIYIKDAQTLVSLLGMMGSFRAMLELESLRVEKEMRGKVNRVVNCDTANSKRVAESALRHIQVAKYLKEQGLLEKLPTELKEVVELRLEHPDCSLRELAELCHPPIGKSGLNHRLLKLEALAHEHQSAAQNTLE